MGWLLSIFWFWKYRSRFSLRSTVVALSSFLCLCRCFLDFALHEGQGPAAVVLSQICRSCNILDWILYLCLWALGVWLWWQPATVVHFLPSLTFLYEILPSHFICSSIWALKTICACAILYLPKPHSLWLHHFFQLFGIGMTWSIINTSVCITEDS